MTQRIRVLIVDDHPIFRAGLRQLLALESSLEVIGEAEHGRQAIDCALADRPDVVLMDLDMPEMSGYDAMEELGQRGYEGKVLVLTMYSDPDSLYRALHCGAHGFLCKTNPVQDIVAAIQDAITGSAPLDVGLLQRIVADARSRALAESEPG